MSRHGLVWMVHEAWGYKVFWKSFICLEDGYIIYEMNSGLGLREEKTTWFRTCSMIVHRQPGTTVSIRMHWPEDIGNEKRWWHLKCSIPFAGHKQDHISSPQSLKCLTEMVFQASNCLPFESVTIPFTHQVFPTELTRRRTVPQHAELHRPWPPMLTSDFTHLLLPRYNPHKVLSLPTKLAIIPQKTCSLQHSHHRHSTRTLTSAVHYLKTSEPRIQSTVNTTHPFHLSLHMTMLHEKLHECIS